MRPNHAHLGSFRLAQPETLESRWLMSGDGIGLGPAAADTVQAADETPPAAPVTFESLEALRAWIAAEATERYGDLFGTTQTRPYWGWGDIGMPFLRTTNTLAFNDGTADHSTTNTQVAGVDEADLVETDGEFVYLISGNELVLVDARDPEDLQVASRVELAGNPSGMYLDGDRLTIVSTSRPNFYYGGPVLFDAIWPGGQTDSPTVTVTVFDLADRAAPTQVEQTEIDGNLLSSRLVDGQLRLVTQQSISRYLPSPNYTVEAKEVAVEGVTNEAPPVQAGVASLTIAAGDFAWPIDYTPREYEYTYETLDEYVDRIVQQWAPGYRTLSADGVVIDSGFIIDPTEIEVPDTERPDYWNYFGGTRATVMTFDVTDEAAGPNDTLSIDMGPGVQLHGTEEGLYLLANSPALNWVGRNAIGQVYIPPQTDIWKLSFGEDGTIEQEATGRVLGHLPDQFAADEHDGYFRVVTRTGGWRDGDQRLTVLEQDGDKLVEVGAINSLAPGEAIHSVRFQCDEAFVVTFRLVDPLFAIDLSDPANPTVEGELKITGFSNYLHPLGEDYLLGVGRDADETTGGIGDMQVSIFEVGDLADPELIHRYTIGEGENWSSTAVGWGWTSRVEHHAFSFFEEQGVLALPVRNSPWHIWLGGDGPTSTSEEPGLQPGDSGLLVMSIDVTAGISEIGIIEHTTPIQRSLRIGDTLFAVSSGQISTHDFGDLTGELDRLDLTAPMVTRTRTFAPPAREAIAGGTAVESAPATEQAVTEAPSRSRVPFVPTIRESANGAPGRAASVRASDTVTSRDATLLLIDEALAIDTDEPTDLADGSTDESEVETLQRTVRSSWRPSVAAR